MIWRGGDLWRGRDLWHGRDISRSMVALVASLGALALLGLVTRVPGWLGHDEGFANVPPGLLTVAPAAKGVATLGGGAAVSLYSDGMRITRDDGLLTETVVSGSMLSAVVGRVSVTADGAREHVDSHLDNVRIDELVFLPGNATYLGRVYDGSRSLPLTLGVQLAGAVIRITASVPGADAIVFHLDHRPATTGIRPAMRPVNLRKTASWIRPSTLDGQAAFTNLLGTDVGVGPQPVPRGVDVRAQGRTDVHVWSDTAYLTVSSQAPPRPTPTPTPTATTSTS